MWKTLVHLKAFSFAYFLVTQVLEFFMHCSKCKVSFHWFQRVAGAAALGELEIPHDRAAEPEPAIFGGAGAGAGD